MREGMMVSVITDSCASIPAELIAATSLTVVPYFIHEQGQTWRDLVDVSAEAFFQRLPLARTLPKTATPSPGDYLAAFRELSRHSCEIVTVHASSKVSGAYQAALVARDLAAAELPDLRVEVVDTLQVAMSQGWAALEAARAARAGGTLQQVADTARRVAAATVTILTGDTLKYLYAGGRIGRAQHLMGSLLNVKPLIGVEDGVAVALGTARTQSRAYRAIVDKIAQRPHGSGALKVAVMHAAAAEKAQQLRHAIEARFVCSEVLVAELSPAMGVHSGPGTVGVSYFACPGA
jgi:DegV family protein with EDD domain